MQQTTVRRMAAGGGMALGVMAFALAPSLASTNSGSESIVGRDPSKSSIQPTAVPLGGGDDEIVVRSTPRAEQAPNRTVRPATIGPAAPGHPSAAPRPGQTTATGRPQPTAPGTDSEQPTTGGTQEQHESDQGESGQDEPESSTPQTSAPAAPPPTSRAPAPPHTTAPAPSAPASEAPAPSEPVYTPAPDPLPGRPAISPGDDTVICNDSDTFTVSFSASNATSYRVQVLGIDERTSATSMTVPCPNPQSEDSYVNVTVTGLNDNPQGGPFASVRLLVKAPLGSGPTEAPVVENSPQQVAPTTSAQNGETQNGGTQDGETQDGEGSGSNTPDDTSSSAPSTTSPTAPTATETSPTP